MGRTTRGQAELPTDVRKDILLKEDTRDDYLSENKLARTQEMKSEMLDSGTYALSYGGYSGTKTVNKTGYFAQENVKEYQKAFITHLFGKDKPLKQGRGSFFETPEEFEKWATEFFQLCYETEVVPTISGLACWLKIDRNKLYEHKNNPNSQFHECCTQAIELCHVALENGASENKLNSVAYIFQAKNYFGMRDTTDVQIQAKPSEEVNTTNTLDALKEQKQRELTALEMHGSAEITGEDE